MKRRLPLSILAAALICATPLAARAGQLTVAAAADLTFALREAAAQFRQQTGNSVLLAYGSSGNFFSQIANGAPYDIFFSADVAYPKRLEAAGLTEPGSMFEYAVGRIVIWVPSNSSLDLRRGVPLLLEKQVRKIAIANPQHAPYGRAAVAAMRHAGIYDRVKERLVLGESVSQAAQFVVSGNADAGIIALSLAVAPPMKAKGRYVEIPAEDYPAIIQAAVVLKRAPDKQLASQFLAFLQQPPGVALMEKYGFLRASVKAPSRTVSAVPAVSASPAASN
jgi:molybdate transport system substrate-binding protein